MFRLFECCALSFFERFVLSFSLKIERFVSDSAEIWICGLYFFVIVNSFAVTTGSLVSNAIGAGERRAVFIICRKILRLGYSAGFPLIGVAVCYNRLIIGIYTDNELLTEQAFIPFVVTLLNYTFALPGYVYLNAVGGTGKTRITFLFQVTTTVVYLGYLYWLSACTHASLAIYLTAEYLFVILLALQSVFYLRSKQY